MPVVDHGQRIQVVGGRHSAGNGEKGWRGKKYRIGKNGQQFIIYGTKSILDVEKNIAAIQKHFGCNRTTAFRMALHLTADAVRHGRLSL